MGAKSHRGGQVRLQRTGCEYYKMNCQCISQTSRIEVNRGAVALNPYSLWSTD